jgi:HpcH/HpaI aldolase/citrate lyase family
VPTRLVLTLWTADPRLAAAADAAGVDRIGCDLERYGKRARQQAWNSWISEHQIEDLPRVRAALRNADLFVRVDPIHERTNEQLARVLAAGARVVMLPMAEDPAGIASVAAAMGDARFILMIETVRGVAMIDELVQVPSVDEIHIGPNDLAASLGLENRFSAYVHEAAEAVAEAAASAGLPFGIGGIARPDDNRLPIAPDLVYAQLVRLHASRALVSRSFEPHPDGSLLADIARARRCFAEWCDADPATLDQARSALADLARGLGRL